MKILAIAVGLLAILAAILGYNVWRAENDPVTTIPGPLQTAQAQLDSQLHEAESREPEIEKQYWDSPKQLRILINSHQQRIQQLTGNTQAGAILAHDREAVARLEKRIAELEAERLAQVPRSEPEQPSRSRPPQAALGKPAPPDQRP
jgi:hypothetical protein